MTFPVRVPLGKPLELSDETLTELTTPEAMTPDFLEARELSRKWDTLADKSLQGLLDAVQKDNE